MANPTRFAQLLGLPSKSATSEVSEDHHARLSRVQANVAQVLNPVAQALGKTPIMGAPPPPWIAPDLQNGFIDSGSDAGRPSFHKDALGYVHGRGEAKIVAGTAGSTVVYTLPLPCRPSLVLRVPVFGTGITLQWLSISPNGDVTALLAIAAPGIVDVNFDFLAGAPER